MSFGINQRDADGVPKDRDALAAARRVSIDDAIRNVVRDEADLRLWDQRFAAVLNFMDIARAHGDHQIWTSEHSRQIRALMEIGDAAVTGGAAGAVIPQGFAVPIRTQLAAAFLKAQEAKTGATPRPANGDATDHVEIAAP